MGCIHHAFTLELDPDAVRFRSRENDVELNLWPAIGDKGMLTARDLAFFIAERASCREQSELSWCPMGLRRVDYVRVLPSGCLLAAGIACCRSAAIICNDHNKACSLIRCAQRSHASAA